jgi:hypothetical protein
VGDGTKGGHQCGLRECGNRKWWWWPVAAWLVSGDELKVAQRAREKTERVSGRVVVGTRTHARWFVPAAALRFDEGRSSCGLVVIRFRVELFSKVKSLDFLLSCSVKMA